MLVRWGGASRDPGDRGSTGLLLTSDLEVPDLLPLPLQPVWLPCSRGLQYHRTCGTLGYFGTKLAQIGNWAGCGQSDQIRGPEGLTMLRNGASGTEIRISTGFYSGKYIFRPFGRPEGRF